MILKIAYLALALIVTGIVLMADQRLAKQIQLPIRMHVALPVWHIYLYLIALSGITETLSFPPRFVLLTILPAFLFIAWYAYQLKRHEWSQVIRPHYLILFQFFRIGIELLFISTLHKGLLHKHITIEGYNFDMIFAATSLLAGWLVMRGHYRIGIAWNYIGLMVIGSIIVVVQTTIYMPDLYGPDTAPFNIAFIQYPYLLVAGFLMPVAVFVHVLSILQLRALKKARRA